MKKSKQQKTKSTRPARTALNDRHQSTPLHGRHSRPRLADWLASCNQPSSKQICRVSLPNYNSVSSEETVIACGNWELQTKNNPWTTATGCSTPACGGKKKEWCPWLASFTLTTQNMAISQGFDRRFQKPGSQQITALGSLPPEA